MRQRDAVILVDAATAIRLAHASDVRHPEGAAGCVRARANVLPRYEDRHVVVIRMRIVAGIQLLLPLAEIVQSFVRVHRDVQPLLGQKRDLSRVIEARRGAARFAGSIRRSGAGAGTLRTSASSSSSRMILTTTMLMKLPIVGSR